MSPRAAFILIVLTEKEWRIIALLNATNPLIGDLEAVKDVSKPNGLLGNFTHATLPSQKLDYKPPRLHLRMRESGGPCAQPRLYAGCQRSYAPVVVVQIITGVLLGLGVLGAAYPDHYKFVFSPPVIQSLNGIAWWTVMIFVMIAGIELDLGRAMGLSSMDGGVDE